jgi:hypothetical protein
MLEFNARIFLACLSTLTLTMVPLTHRFLMHLSVSHALQSRLSLRLLLGKQDYLMVVHLSSATKSLFNNKASVLLV